MTTLVCRGVLRRSGNGASEATTFEPERCAGCTGRCGIRLGQARTRLALGDLPDGTPVEFVAIPAALARRALFVFGAPIALAALAVLAGAPGWLAAVAFLGGVALAVGVRFVWPIDPQVAEPEVAVEDDPRLVRIRLR